MNFLCRRGVGNLSETKTTPSPAAAGVRKSPVSHMFFVHRLCLFNAVCLRTLGELSPRIHYVFTETESTRFFRVETVLDLEQQWKQEPNQTNISGLHQFHICADDVLIPS